MHGPQVMAGTHSHSAWASGDGRHVASMWHAGMRHGPLVMTHVASMLHAGAHSHNGPQFGAFLKGFLG